MDKVCCKDINQHDQVDSWDIGPSSDILEIKKSLLHLSAGLMTFRRMKDCELMMNQMEKLERLEEQETSFDEDILPVQVAVVLAW